MPNRLPKIVSLTLRWGILAVGMFLSACGIACVALAGLGTTPISSLPYTLCPITGLTFGQTTVIVNVVFVFMEWVFLQKLFHLTNLCQIPSVWVFGLFIDLAMHLLQGVAATVDSFGYPAMLAMSLIGNAILGLGIVLQVESKTLVQPGEGVVLAASVRFKKAFGNVKIFNDCFLVALAAAVGLAYLGTVYGIREGTLISAVMVGLCVKFWYRIGYALNVIPPKALVKAE